MKIKHLLEDRAPGGTRAAQFIITAERWLETSLARHGVHMPEMDEIGPRRVRITPLIVPSKRSKVAIAVIEHFGKLADLLQVTLEIDGIAGSPELLYPGFVAQGTKMIRQPTSAI